jgi:hypothetical protein
MNDLIRSARDDVEDIIRLIEEQSADEDFDIVETLDATYEKLKSLRDMLATHETD